MAAITGGDITEVTCNHPALGNFTFFPKAGEDSTFDNGGIRTNDDAQGVDGGGNTIRILNRTRWMAQFTFACDLKAAGDTMSRLSNLAADTEEGDWTISLINGAVYGAKGSVVGDIKPNPNQATVQITISGGGQMNRIV